MTLRWRLRGKAAGFFVGARVSELLREGAERFAGVALIAVGGLQVLGKFGALPS